MADNYVGISIKATDGAKPELDDLKLKLDELKDRVATARADVSTAEADAKLTDLEAKLEAVSKRVANPKIDIAGASRANAQITAVEASLEKMDADSVASAGKASAQRQAIIQAEVEKELELERAAVREQATAADAGASAQVAAAKKSTAANEESAATAGAMGSKVKMAFLGVAIGAGLAVKGAADFQAQTVRLVTSAGESAKNLGMVQQGMLGISAQTATSTSEMASGMYTVESAGFHGAQGLTVLKAAAQGAKDEGAQLSTVANGVTDALVDFHLPASAAANVTSQLIAAVSRGKTNFEEFSGSMSNVLPLAAAMHLKLADVSGVLAEMTAHGMSAQRASEDEANAMRELMKPNAAMVKEFKALGISSDEVYKKLGTAGLGGTMQWLSGIAQDGAGKIGQNYTQALGKLMGSAAGLQTALMTTGENAGATNKAIAGIGAASADAKGNVDGFSQVSGTAAFKMQAATESIKAAGISLGSALLPAVTAVLGPITSMLQLIASNKVAADAFALVVGGVLAGALGGKLVGALRDMKSGIEGVGSGAQWLIGKLTAATAAQEAQTVATEAATVAQAELDVAEEANPIGLIIVAIVALIAVIVLVVTHLHFFAHAFDVVRHAVATAGHDIAAGFDKIRHDVAAAIDAVINWVKAHWKLILAILLDPIGVAVMEIRQHWAQIEQVFVNAYHAVVSTLTGFRHDVASAFDAVRHSIAAFADWLPGAVSRAWQLAVRAQLTMLDTARHDVAAAFDAVRHAVAAGVDAVLAFFQKLPGQVASFLAKLPGDMLTIGKNVITGLINGIKSAAAAIPGIMKSLASDVASYFTNPLKLFSPSRVFMEHGENIVQGAIIGVQQTAPRLRATMQQLGRQVAGTSLGGAQAGGALTGAGGGVVRHQLEFTGNGSDALFKWFREQIRIKGGNVQSVLGTG